MQRSITDSGLENSSAKVYPAGTVLIAMIGEGKTRGQAAILDMAACTNQNVAGLVLEVPQLRPEYVWYWALGEYERTRMGAQGGNYPALNGSKVRSLPIPLPPAAEAEEIVRRVTALFTLAETAERLAATAWSCVCTLPKAILSRSFG